MPRATVPNNRTLFGSGTPEPVGTEPVTLITAKSPGASEVPEEGRRVTFIVGESAIKVVPSESSRSIWLNVAEKTADVNRVVSGNCNSNGGVNGPGAIYQAKSALSLHHSLSSCGS